MSSQEVDRARSHGHSRPADRLALTCCLLGVLVSLYAFHVESVAEGDADYVAYCDVSEHVSCTAVLSSRYGRGFGLLGLLIGDNSPFNLPNSLFGVAFYILQVLLELKSTHTSSRLQTLASILANIGSVYLAAILYFVVRSFCLVCVTIYVINLALLVLNVQKLNAFVRDRSKNTRPKKS